ncbi:MAG: radical SAM protein [Anaerohalosphaeraceae bacterium]|nr:radical SAM protein [Anaerohalosphaeraceae bacterium]
MTSADGKSYVFGPVPSRRLGRSLGIDLVPFKVCSYDCLYCQVGFTTEKGIRQQNFVPLEDVIDDLKVKLDSEPDYITLSGSGEPTLYSRFGELINRIKRITSVPVAVITNGSTLSFPQTREALKSADLVVPSLDAADEQTFRKINQPCREITFDKMLQGLIDFRREFSGKYWLEVFLIAALNDSDEHIQKLKSCIERIAPDKVQLNTVVRPAADNSVRPVSAERMAAIAKVIYKNAEVIANYSGVPAGDGFAACGEDIYQMLKRRPCSAQDIAIGLSIGLNEAIKYLQILLESNKISTYKQGQTTFYKVII